MKTHTVEIVDSLSLLSLKVASNVLDLSSRQHHVSIRDQIVRAQLVVRDLVRGDSGFDALLIVGAGVAGIAAALEAVDRGVKTVVVVEAGPEPFGLLKGVTGRYVGPYMYEWPSPFSNDQSYPAHGGTPWADQASAPLHWNAKDPLPASALFDVFTDLLEARMAGPGRAPIVCVHVDKERIATFVKAFASHESARTMARLQRHMPPTPLGFSCWNETAWPGTGLAQTTITPQYVLLAAGMGAEDVTLIGKDRSGKSHTGTNYPGPRFWGDDTLMDPHTPDRQMGIFGGGDGALQDVLRALTRRDHPLQFLAFLMREPRCKTALERAMPALLAMERQARQSGAWTANGSSLKTVDACCRTVAKRLAHNEPRLVRRVIKGVVQGKGQVSLFVRGTHFDKAYLLNRFLVHLLIACKRAQPAKWTGRMDFEVLFEHRAIAYASAGDGHEVTIEMSVPTGMSLSGWPVSRKAQYLYPCDVIAVRYGIERGTVPGAQMIQVSQKPSRQRTTLSRVELPFVAEKD